MEKEKTDEKPVAVLGGGISGLTTAWFLKKAGIPFKLFEKSGQTGGKIKSVHHANTVMDFGPNSIRDRSGNIQQLAKELAIDDALVKISEAFKTRYLVRNGELQELAPRISTLFSTKVIRVAAKLRILSEPFRKPKRDAEDESVGEFLERRIGREAVDYLIDPVLSGIYAGDVYRMSKDYAMPKLADFERNNGSLTWGAIRSEKQEKNSKAEVITFKKGIQQLTDELTKHLLEDIIYDEVSALKTTDGGYLISCKNIEFEASKIISCLPAPQLAEIVKDFDHMLEAALDRISYSPMLSTQLVYEKDAIANRKSGFGFLIPRKENYRLLGAIWKSEIFPDLSAPERIHFTLMTGGAHDPQIKTDEIADVEEQIVSEFSQLMNISARPALVKSKLWENAIPQMEVGYGNIIREIKGAEKRHRGFHIGGNYRWGISVPDCVEGAEKLVERIKVS